MKQEHLKVTINRRIRGGNDFTSVSQQLKQAVQHRAAAAYNNNAKLEF